MKVQPIVLSARSSVDPILQQTVIDLGHTIRLVTGVQELKHAIENVDVGMIFLSSSPLYNVYDLCREITLQYPLLAVILLVPANEMDMKRAMHAGALDIVMTPIVQSELEQAVVEAKLLLMQKSTGNVQEEMIEPKQGRVLAVCGTKGGIGKTTIAVNTAAAISKYNSSVAILDLDLQFGDVADFLDIQPKRTIYDWVKEEYSKPECNIEKYLVQHQEGVHIFAAPQRPEFADVILGEHVKKAITELRQKFDVVIVDLPSTLLESGLVALDDADEILLVASMELPTLKNTKRFLETLQSLGLLERVKLILNRDSEVTEIRVDTVESILEMTIFARIPSEGKVVVPSVNRGVPFVLSNPRANVSRSIYTLATKLYMRERKPKKADRKSLIRRMFGR